MGRNPLVSIIVPAYNHEKYIGECLESIISQSYRHIEAIVIDDGSLDGTPGIIERFQKSYPDIIRYYHQENQGVIKTNNRGLRLARGVYASVLASDDLLLPEKISREVSILESQPDCAFVCSNGYFIRGETKTTDLFIKEKSKEVFTLNHQLAYRSLLTKNVIYSLTVLFNQDLALALGGFDERIPFVEDWNLWLSLVRTHPISYIDEPLVYYRTHEDNFSKNYEKIFLGKLHTLERHFENPELRGETRFKQTLLANLYYDYAMKLITEGRRKDARRAFWRAMRYSPFQIKYYARYILSVL